MKRFIIIFSLIVILAGTANALNLGEINNPLPTITVVYPESVTIIESTLLNSSGHNKVIIDDPDFNDPNNKIFKYKVTELLIEDSYVFSVTAEDEHGNSEVSIYTFSIRIIPLSIILTEPALAYSPSSPSLITFKTERAVKCRYSVDVELTIFDSLERFDITNDIYHTITAFDFDIPTLLPDQKRRIYVKCNDTYRDGEIIGNNFNLFLDNTKPTIDTISADPQLVIEPPYESMLTLTTNEDTICKYGEGITDYGLMTPFGSYFDTTHAVTVTVPLEPKSYTYYFNCMNKAGLISNKTEEDNIILTVDPNVELSLTIDTNRVSSDPSVIFELTTNKVAECFYSTNSDFSESIKFITTNSRHHINPAIILPLGGHDYYFDCRKGAERATDSLHIIIDTTPPNMIPPVNDAGPLADNEDITYYTDRLEASWLAEDNQTGVSSYEYLIYLVGRPSGYILLINETTADTSVVQEGLTLNNSRKYFFKVRAMNPVGLWSKYLTSNGITVDNTSKPATCDDTIKNGDEMDTDCGGSCPKCEAGKECDLDDDCLTGYCNVQSLCAFAGCNDTEKNGNETDTDCGGSCPPCGEGDVCKSDSDCISDECLATKCTQPETCENSKLDEDETDFDCGGPCKKCESGKQCKDDSDCIGHFCKGSVCLEASCEDKELNQGEANIDCGGPCPGCEIGSSCDLNSDCSSGNCEANICVQPLDSDSDGLPNDWEILYDLDPNNKDSDENGILDPDEDLDDDGLTNLEEWESKYAIDPRNSDTDGDSYSDKEELDAGTDPTDSESFPRPNYFLIILVITVIIGVFGGGGYYGYKYIKENKEMIKSWLKTKLKKSIPAKQPTQSPKAQPASPLQRPIIPSQRAAPRVPVKTALHKKRIIKQKAEKGKKREKLFESFSGEGLGEAKPPKKAKKPSADDFDIKPIKLKPLKKKKRTYPLHRHIAGKSTAATRKPITSIGRTPPTTTKAMPTTSLSPSQTAQKPAIPPKAHPSGIMDQLKSLISKPEEKAGPLGKIRNPLKTTKLTLAKPPSSKPAPIGKINVFDKLMGFSKHDLTKLEVKQHLSKHMSNTFGKEIKEDTFNKLTNLVKSDKVERKDIFNTIKHLSKRGHKEFTKTASKHMLSHLINTNKSNKAHVTDVLHSLKDKKIFSDDDVFDILGHIEEHEQKK